MKEQILITGATGNIGLETLKFLILRDLSLVAALRDPEKNKILLPAGVICVLFDFENPDTYETAVSGIKKVYLVRPPAISGVKRYIKPFIEFLKQTEVKHIVLLSL